MRKSLILASLLASATAVNAEIYIDGGVNWTLYTPDHINTDLPSGLFNPASNISYYKTAFEAKRTVKGDSQHPHSWANSRNYGFLGSNLDGGVPYVQFTNASTSINLDGQTVSHQFEGEHILSDALTAEDFTLPYDRLVNGAEFHLNLFATEPSQVQLVTQSIFNLSPKDKSLAGQEYPILSETWYKQNEMFNSAYGTTLLPKTCEEAWANHPYAESNDCTMPNSITEYRPYYFIPNLKSEQQRGKSHPADRREAEMRFLNTHPHHIDEPNVCTVKTKLNGRDIGSQRDTSLFSIWGRSATALPPLKNENHVLDLKAGKNTVTVTTLCDVEQYGRGNLSNDFTNRFKSLAFTLADAATQQPVTLVNYAPKESVATKIEGMLSQQAPHLSSDMQMVQALRNAPLKPTTEIGTISLLSSTSDAKGDLSFVEKTGIYKGTFYPKQLGKYEFMVMTKSNMLEARNVGQYTYPPTSLKDLLTGWYEGQYPLFFASNVSFHNVGWVHPDYTLHLGEYKLAQNRMRVDGLDTLPNNWNVSYFNVTKDHSKKGLPFTFSVLGNKGWKERPFKEMFKDRLTSIAVTKALWATKYGGGYNITEYTSMNPNTSFSQEIALYVKEPTSNTFRPVNAEDFIPYQ